ncbi:MAG TPA: nicotinate-nucleotide adenylyltransferase [Nitrolancea sp.]
MDLTRPERLGILGGTFDPVHLGHLIIAEELKFRLELEHVLFLPSRRPPHKTLQEISPNADRMTMLELAIEGNPHFGISTVDMHREGLSFTSDSLAIIRDEHPETDIFFLMGQDSLRDLPSWHEPNFIAERARLGVALRPGVEVDVDAILRAVPAARGRLQLIPVPLIQISSREIRRRVYHGEPITYQVPRAVEDHIRKVGLYVPQ